MNQVRIGKFIAERRKEKNYTQKVLGKMIKADSKTISKWECGAYAPDIIYLIPLSHALGVTVNELLEVEKSKKAKYDEQFIVQNLKYYSDQAKKKTIFKAFIVLLIIILCAITIFFIITFKEWHIVDFTKEQNDYFIKGSVIYNKKESIFFINNFTYNSIYIGTEEEPLIKEMDIALYLDDQLVGKNSMTFDKPILLHKALQKFYFYKNVSTIAYDKKKEVKFIITYINEKNEKFSEKIILKDFISR